VTYGGIELIVWYLADGLSKLGDEVILAAPPGSVAPNPNVRTIENIHQNEMYAENRIPGNLKSVIESFKPDIIHDASHTKALYGLAKEMKLHYIPNAHNITIPQFPEQKINLVTLSKKHSDWIYEKYGVQSKWVHNGVDVSRFHAVNKKVKLDRYLLLGRPNPEKGLLEVIGYCMKNKLPLDVVSGIIPGDARAYQLEVARACLFMSTVQFHGEVSDRRKHEFLERAKAMVFWPQVHEAFGLVTIEALLSGTPVIGNDMGAMPEQIEEGKNGFIIPVEKDEQGREKYSPSVMGWNHLSMDEDKIKEAFAKLSTLEDPQSIRGGAITKFSHETMSSRYHDIYESVLNGETW
jgi:glycosyltransferase involved in cell wall biosynthesis